MFEIEVMAAPGVGCCRIRIGRTLFVLLLSVASIPHVHW
jgi:hypothetical protein